MVAMLAHRGPDGHGFYRDSRAGLAHARLSLIDLAGGFQPIHNHDRSLWLTFNGEIFNYKELRAELAALGHRFYTQGDGEVIVHAFERYGANAWRMLNGQFAFALWDTRARCLWLVRDRMGVLPLHYSVAGNHLVFASEAKAIFAGGRVRRDLDPRGIAEAFTLWSTIAPRTAFRDVRSVRPATALCIDGNLRLTEQRYWEPDPHAAGRETTEQAAEQLHEHLLRSVRLRLRADVPVGSYVSGGLDSSVLSAYAKNEVGPSLETFGIRFADPRYDETAEQRQVAGHLGTRHHEILCDGAAIRGAMADVVWHCEAPLLRTSPIPMFLLSKLVRDNGTKTVLSGEGADELFAGYTIFKEDQIRRFIGRQPDSAVRPALLSRIHHYVGDARARATPFWRDFFRRNVDDPAHPFHSHLIRWQNNAWTLRLLAPEVQQAADLAATMERLESNLPAGWQNWDSLLRAQLTEIHGFMSSYLLASQGDRVAMAHGVEVRYPFLDPDVIDFAMTLPRRHKLLGSRDKIVLRRLAARLLPPAMAGRKKKPFRAPIAPVLFGTEARGAFDHILAAGGDGLVDDAAVGRLITKVRLHDGRAAGEREEMGLIGVLTLRMLAQQYGPEFDARAEAARRRLEQSQVHVLEDRVGEGVRAAVGVI